LVECRVRHAHFGYSNCAANETVAIKVKKLAVPHGFTNRWMDYV